MATYKAGMRVKIVRGWKKEDAPTSAARIAQSNGCHEGVLVRRIESDFFLDILVGSRGDWLMRLDNGVEGAVHEYMLEPIQPERNRVVSWESLNLPFDPRKVLEGVS